MDVFVVTPPAYIFIYFLGLAIVAVIAVELTVALTRPISSHQIPPLTQSTFCRVIVLSVNLALTIEPLLRDVPLFTFLRRSLCVIFLVTEASTSTIGNSS